MEPVNFDPKINNYPLGKLGGITLGQPRRAEGSKGIEGYQRVDGIAYTNQDGYTGLTDTAVSPLQGQLGLKEKNNFVPHVFVA